MIYTLISASTLGFICFRIICRFSLCEPNYVSRMGILEVLWIKEDGKSGLNTPNTDQPWSVSWPRRIQEKQQDKNWPQSVCGNAHGPLWAGSPRVSMISLQLYDFQAFLMFVAFISAIKAMFCCFHSNPIPFYHNPSSRLGFRLD